MIARRTIIAGSTGPIFAIFLPNESVLGADNWSRPLFPISQRTLPWQPILWKNGKLPSFVTLALQNRLGYCYLNMCINSVHVNNASISNEYFVKFSPVTSELTELICKRQIRHGQKTGVFSPISQDILDWFSNLFTIWKRSSCRWWICTLFSNFLRYIAMATK